MKRRIIFLVLCVITLVANAQKTYTTVFSYDNAGNRIKRKVCVSTYTISTKSHKNSSDSIPEKGATDDLLSCKVTIYPNTTKDLVYLAISGIDGEDKISKIEVYSENGQLLETIQKTGNATIPVDLTSYVSGIYVIRFYQENNMHIYKIIKQ